MSNMAVHFSSKTDDWATPQDLFDRLNAEFGPFDLDACATLSNSKCETFISPSDNGLRVPHWLSWSKDPEYGDYLNYRIWMNPPYGREIGKWVQKAYEESQKGCLVCCLLPARTDTKWFHDYCTKGEIRFLRGRVKFGGAKTGAPFPSMVVVFRPGGAK